MQTKIEMIGINFSDVTKPILKVSWCRFSNKKKGIVLPDNITFPWFVLIVFCSVSLCLCSISFMILHKEIDGNTRLLLTFIIFSLFLFIMKYSYKWLIPSLLNIDKKRIKKLIEQLKKELLLHNGQFTPEQLQNIGARLADPSFNIEHYANNVRGFIELIENGAEAELRMKARFLEATSTMIVTGGGYVNPKNKKK